MSRWWRAYDEAVDDPKLQGPGLEMVGAWFNLMCIASKNGGIIRVGDVPFALRISKAKAAAIITTLVGAGLLDRVGNDYMPHNWEGRQYKSDNSYERVKRHRAALAKKNETPTVTEMKRFKTVTVTPPEQNRTDSVPKGTADEVVGEDPKAKLFRVGKTLLVSFGVAEKRTGALIGQWLKNRNDPGGLLAAIQFARDQNVAEPVAYISALLNRQERPNGKPKQTLSDLAFELADEWRRREREAGLFGSDDNAGSH